MSYGRDKIKDVAESVLPSTHRKGARDDLRLIKQKNRALIRRELRRIDSLDTYYDDPRVAAADHYYYPDTDIRYAVLDRRNGDKLSVMRWAEGKTAKLGITDPHERYAYAKRILPDNLIGRHALSHIENIDGFCNGITEPYKGCPDHTLARPLYRKYSRRYGALVEEKEWREIELLLFFQRLLTKKGQHKALNAAIKKAHRAGHRQRIPGTLHVDEEGKWRHDTQMVLCEFCSSPRILRGGHDVEQWVKDVFYAKPGIIGQEWMGTTSGGGCGSTLYTAEPHREWKKAASAFLPLR